MPDTRALINDIYSGIIAPQGGLYQPGPPVMLPPQAPPLRTQTPTQKLAQALTGADPVGDSLAPWAQLDDQVMASQAIPSANGTMVANKDQSQLAPSPAGNMFAYGDASPTAPGAQAIGQALLQGSPSAPTDTQASTLGGQTDGMTWQPSTPGPAPAGDPWAGARIGNPSVQQTPGMTTSNRGLGAIGAPVQQAPQPAASAYQQALAQAAQKFNTTPDAIHQQLMAQQTDVPQQSDEAPGSGFLRAQGVNTSGMSAGQQANALNKSIFGKGFGG